MKTNHNQQPDLKEHISQSLGGGEGMEGVAR